MKNPPQKNFKILKIPKTMLKSRLRLCLPLVPYGHVTVIIFFFLVPRGTFSPGKFTTQCLLARTVIYVVYEVVKEKEKLKIPKKI